MLDTRYIFYDSADRVTTERDFRGNDTTYQYDADNRMTLMTNAEGFSWGYGYDGVGNVTTINDGRGNTWTKTYDNRNRVKTEADPLGHTKEYFYDTESNVTAADDAEDDKTQYEYNALNLQTAMVTPLGHRSETNYDAGGRMTSTKDANGFLTSYEYNARNERTKMTDARGYNTQWEYDGAGNMTKWIDAVGNETQFAYEARNLVSSKTDPNGKISTYDYDAAGQMTSTIDRLGRKREFVYDNNGRVTSEKWYTGQTLDETLNWSYDPNGNVLTADNSAGGYVLTYDKINQVKTAQDVWGKTLTMTYDGNGNRTKRSDSEGGVQDNTYDAANRVTKITHSGTGQTPLRVDQTYTDDNRTDTITRYSDLAGTTKVGSSNYDYDADGRLTDLQHLDGSDANIADYDFAYDPGNRLTSETLNTVTKTYQYDDTNELTDDNGTSHSYDGTGNRTNTGYSTGTGNRITSDGTWTYTHDDEGNLTKKSKGASAETWTYGYDHRNQMTSAEKRATDGGTLLLSAEYKYDVNGNRIEKEVDEDGDTTIDLTERYAYDGYKPGNGFVGNENWDIWAELDDTNAIDMRYLRGDLIDQVFAQHDGSTTNWLLGDHIGTIRNVTDGTGANKNTISYDAFGKITNQTDPNFSSRYSFASREYDAETQFLYNRARFYSPEIGRWTSEDPLGFGAGDSNLFRYVTNQPTTQTDPSGLDGISPNAEQYAQAGMHIGFVFSKAKFWDVYHAVKEGLNTDEQRQLFFYGFFAGQLSAHPEEMAKRKAEQFKAARQLADMVRAREVPGWLQWWDGRHYAKSRKEGALELRHSQLMSPYYRMTSEGRLRYVVPHEDFAQRYIVEHGSAAAARKARSNSIRNSQRGLVSDPTPLIIVSSAGTGLMMNGLLATGYGALAGAGLSGSYNLANQIGGIIHGNQESFDFREFLVQTGVGGAIGAGGAVLSPFRLPAIAGRVLFGVGVGIGLIDAGRAATEGKWATAGLRAAVTVFGAAGLRRIFTRLACFAPGSRITVGGGDPIARSSATSKIADNRNAAWRTTYMTVGLMTMAVTIAVGIWQLQRQRRKREEEEAYARWRYRINVF